ncbi:MAG: multicopper oxidase domain-containing protein [Syntrophobacter sp.]
MFPLPRTNHSRRKGLLFSAICCSVFVLCASSAFAQGAACATGTVQAFPGADYCVIDPLYLITNYGYVQPLVIPPVMPPSSDPKANYNIAERQFKQQILPGGVWNQVTGRNDPYPATTVWSYGKAEDRHDLNYTAPMPLSDPGATTFNYPALTIEATQNQLTKVRWINQLFDPATGNYLPHLLPVDRTLHWANVELLTCSDGGVHTDCRPSITDNPASVLQAPYTGPVPMVTHVHGAHVNPESDGYPEAWWLPAANNLAGFATKGGLYDQFDRTNTWPGSALFGYYNTQHASTIWYHDHGLGITRVNVYAGPAGFWLIRGANRSEPDKVSGVLPGPAPALGEDPNFDAAVRSKIREIPIAIQDRTFKPDGSLFFPANRAYFEGLNKAGGTSPTLAIPFIPDSSTINGQPSDVSPIHNPEFFGNTMVVNGTTWPVYNVAQAKYRFRFLNGCNARTLFLKIAANPAATRPAGPALQFHQIGSDGGLLPAPATLDFVRIGPAERADVIIDFSTIASGTSVYLINEGPDMPYGGGLPVTDFPPADPNTTGQVMKFVVDGNLNGASPTDNTASDPASLVFQPRQNLVPAKTRQVSLNEMDSPVIFVEYDQTGAFYHDVAPFSGKNNVVECDPKNFTPTVPGNVCLPYGPTSTMVGTVQPDPLGSGGNIGVPLMWTDTSGVSKMLKVFTKSNGAAVMVPLTETPNLNDVEEWEIWNFTVDAHPIHLHLVEFQVVNREATVSSGPGAFSLTGVTTPPEAWETGWKDTVIAPPGFVTRIKAKFNVAGLYVWHCHIIDHEDNEMMRPMGVIPDLNKDGCVDRTDYNLLLQDIAGARQYDLNGDGKVDTSDATRLTLFYTNPRGAPCK